MVTHFRHTTVGRTPLDEGPARSRDLYLTSHNTHKRQTTMPPVGFEPTILGSERPKINSSHRRGKFVINAEETREKLNGKIMMKEMLTMKHFRLAISYYNTSEIHNYKILGS
jgi:hypothetical protein